MGKIFSCLNCGFSETKVIPLETLPTTVKYSDASLARNDYFHRPLQKQFNACSRPQNLSGEISIRSSLATISLGSVQTLSSSQCEKTEEEDLTDDKQESSPSSKRHPGLPPGETGQQWSSTLPQMIDGRQSRMENLFNKLHNGIFTARTSTPRSGNSTIIMVKPYLDSSHDILEENETQRVCIHGIPLAGTNGDPHEVNCARCERPGSRGGRALAGMMAFQRTKSKKRRAKSICPRQKLTADQEKKKKTKDEYEKALREFAERHQNND